MIVYRNFIDAINEISSSPYRIALGFWPSGDKKGKPIYEPAYAYFKYYFDPTNPMQPPKEIIVLKRSDTGEFITTFPDDKDFVGKYILIRAWAWLLR